MEKMSKGKLVFIILMVLLSIAFFLFKDEFKRFNPSNQVSQQIIRPYIKTNACILRMEVKKGRRGSSNNIYYIQFKDENGEVYNTKLTYNSIITLKDSITIYYDPKSPQNVISKREYDEIM